ncbi:hypothetical protein AAFF_G00265480 [Aldrovandia affinis]|uniref:Uncharacterized protein n=1 Tax=Aldrovandia affinis TaxID=143900 RepID=A0AAD7RE82_9TELE|nr:hypothetical protein AAFF_G00265480 [Aldrovandia affinis]
MSTFLILLNGFFFDYFGTMATRVLAIMSSCGQSKSVVLQGAGTTGSNGDVQRERGAVPQAGNTQPSENTAANVMSFRSCVLSWFFLLHLVWVSAVQLNFLFIIGTLNAMLTRLANGDHSLVSSYTNAFAFTQLCGILCSPLNGLIIGRNKGKPRAPGETEKEADLSSSYFTFVLQVLTMSFLYGGHSAFIRIAFPSCHYGKLFGLVLCLSGVVLLLQFPLTILVNDVLQGNPLYPRSEHADVPGRWVLSCQLREVGYFAPPRVFRH